MNPDKNLLNKSIQLYNSFCLNLQFRKYFISIHKDNPEELDNSFFTFFFKGVNDVNKSFHTLYNSDERNIAYSLIRLQLDNLRLLYAEYLHPNKALYQTFKKNRDINQIQIGKDKLKPSTLNDEIEAKFEGFKALYAKYSKYIHPAKRDFDRYELLKAIDYTNLSKEEIKAKKKELAEGFKQNQEVFYKESVKDMIQINRYILYTFFLIRKYYTNLALEKVDIKEFKKLQIEWKGFFRNPDIIELAEE